MKKILTVLLSIIMLSISFTFIGCRSENKTQKIELTKENYQEYLSIYEGAATFNTNKKYDSLLGIYKYNGSAHATIEISSMDSNNDFENAIINFEIIAWGYNLDNTYEIKLSAQGEGRKQISTYVNNSYSEPDLSSYILRVTSISGYVITSK